MSSLTYALATGWDGLCIDLSASKAPFRALPKQADENDDDDDAGWSLGV